MKKAPVEVVEDFFQVVVMTAGRVNVLASAHLAHESRLGGDVVMGDITAITKVLRAIDRLTIELGEEDVSDCVQHEIGSAFKQIGEADIKVSITHANGVVNGDKRIKPNMHGWCGRAGAELTIGAVKDFGELRHVEGRLAEVIASRQPSGLSKTWRLSAWKEGEGCRISTDKDQMLTTGDTGLGVNLRSKRALICPKVVGNSFSYFCFFFFFT